MKTYDLKLGFSCNNDCVHCVISDKASYPNVSYKDILKIIDSNLDYDRFILTGGEPTIRKDFIDIINYLVIKGKKISLQTNGKMLKNEIFTKKIAPFIDNYLIALHSSNGIIHDKITKTKNSWTDTLNGIYSLYSAIGPDKISTQTVVTRLNAYTIHDTFLFIQKNFPGVRMNLTFPHQSGNAKKYENLIIPRYSDIKYQIYDSLKDFGPLINTEAIPLCYISPFIGAVNYMDQGLIDDNNIISGHDESFETKEILDYKKELLQDKIKVEACNSCYYNNECIGVWKEYGILFEYLDLYPIIKKDLTISVRTKYYKTFKDLFFDSFERFYSEYIPDLHVYIDTNYEEHNKDDYNSYRDLAVKYGFSVHFIKRFPKDYLTMPNHYTYMLWKSVDNHKGKVISFDDDVKFHNTGLFDIMSDLLDSHNVISEKHRGGRPNNTVPHCIASWVYGINNIDFSQEDFSNKNREYCDGNDMVGFTVAYLNDIYYLDKDVERISHESNTSTTKFYRHMNSTTYLYERDILKIDYAKLDGERRNNIINENT